MTLKVRSIIRKLHRDIDGIVGRLFTRQLPLKTHRINTLPKITLRNFENFSYSKLTHFDQFELMPIYSGQVPSTCDLKVYQDLLVYSFITNNIKPKARILEIGGGESRVIASLKENYECWNLDRLHGVGFGPTKLLETDGFRIVKDDIGNFTNELPDAYFDLVYSISTVEHFPKDEKVCALILADILRVLRPGGASIHCVDGLLFNDHLFVHPFVGKVMIEISGAKTCLDHATVMNDPDLWCLSRYAYYTRWYHLTKRSLKQFGKPLSINVVWEKGLTE